MEIIKNHFTRGKPVKRYSEISAIVAEMQEFMRNGGLRHQEYQNGYALAHNQVSETPFAFFVMNPMWPVKRLFKHDVLINPELVEVWKNINIGTKEHPDMRSNMREYPEACFSFPFRKAKKVKRFFAIKVKYQTQGRVGLKTIKETIEGLPAHVFQHELDHTMGKNIYFKK